VHFSRWTLRSRLIGLTVVLVAATALVMGAVLSVVVRSTLSDQFNQDIRSSVRGVDELVDAAQGEGRFLDRSDTIIALSEPSANFQQGYHYSGSGTGTAAAPLSSAAFAALQNGVGPQTGGSSAPGPQDVTIPGLGQYRFTVLFDPSSGTVAYIGKPLSILNARVAAFLAPIAVVVLLAIVLAGLLGALIIGRALRPLRRVAGVATNVASLPLERGDVELPQRVPEQDTNPNTEVGQVGSALNNLLDTVSNALGARQASEDKLRNFVADASHELRTPLASIRGYAELTRRFGGDLTQDVQHNIGRIESEAMRMTSLVEDLLLLARLDAERELETHEVDLSRLLVDVLSDANAAGPDHEWSLDLPEEPVIVRGDEAKLQQVFTNLLANARVHTPAGTTVTLQLSEPKDGHVLAQVRDDGPGIPEQLRPQLFGRFVRGDASRNRATGSTGLGLSIVNAVVQAHHGTVSVASEPGLTVFTVQLPVEQPADLKHPQPA